MTVSSSTSVNFAAADVRVDLLLHRQPHSYYLRLRIGETSLFPRDLAAVDALVAALTETRTRLAKVDGVTA